MSDEPTKIQLLEKQLEEKRAERAKARDAQYEKDLEARLELEDEHGVLAAVSVTRHVPGQPTCAYVRIPEAKEYKRYKAQVYARAQDKRSAVSMQEAQELLAKSCWVYPTTPEARAAMLEAYPGLLTPLSAAASSLAEGKAEEEGKD